MLLPMTRVQIVGVKSCLPQTISLLQRSGAVQIESWSEARAISQQRMAHDEQATRRRERLAYMAAQVEATLAALPVLDLSPAPEYEEFYPRRPDWLLTTVETELAGITPHLQALSIRSDRLEEQLHALPRYEATLRRLLPLVPSFIELEQYAMTAIWLERRYQGALETITRRLEEITGGLCEVVSRPVNQETLAAVLIFPKTEAGPVGKLLGQENISQVRLPAEFSDQPLEKALADIRRRLQEIPGRLAEIRSQQEALARQWRPRLLMWLALLRDHLAQIDVQTDLGQTDYTFVIEGWLPQNRLAELETALGQAVGGEVVVTPLPVRPEERDQVPVAFDNPGLARPFEPLVGLLSLPRYGGFDPTPLMAIFMPIFFGLILGDVAYGLILLALMIYLRRRFKTSFMLRNLAEVLIIGSVWSIVFGFLFGEFFGALGESVGLHPLWFDRGHEVQALFLLSIGIGVGHIVLGLGLGVWQALRHHNRPELIEKTAMLISLTAIFFIVGILAGYLPDSFFTPAIALLVVGLAVLIYSMGGLGFLLGPLELLGTVGNILSYLRLAAIGLSSVYLARVANELGGVVGNLFIGLIIAGLFHALNIALGAFSPTIQSLRLHYVEFFGKFYEGGGRAFRPFRRSIIHH